MAIALRSPFERIPLRTRFRHDDGDAAATLCQPATPCRREEDVGKLPLSEIAFRSGFSSQASFTRAFRRVTT